MFSVDFSLAAMSTHTSWKYYKNCVWTIIAWALLSVSLGYWEWVWLESEPPRVSLLLAPTFGWLSLESPGRGAAAQWPPVGSLCPPSSQPCQLWATGDGGPLTHRHTPSSPHPTLAWVLVTTLRTHIVYNDASRAPTSWTWSSPPSPCWPMCVTSCSCY